jgi:Sulfotransferase family
LLSTSGSPPLAQTNNLVDALRLMSAKKFIFISGAEGSGTRLLRRILAAPSGCASHGHQIAKLPNHPDAGPLFLAFEAANERLWDLMLPPAAHERAGQDFSGAADAMMNSPAFADTTHFVFKRSSPFGGGDRHRPDLLDVVRLPNSRMVIIYRDPCAATYSALRRGFDSDLGRLALRCAEHLTLLASQTRSIDPERLLVISYPRLCQSPETELPRLAQFCGLALEPDTLPESLIRDADARYRKELAPADADWLEHFFEARISQWGSLLG